MRTLFPMGGRWLRGGAALVLIVAAFAVYLVGSPATVDAADVAVTINSFAFMPGTVMVPVGTRVVWTNQQSGVSHTTTSDTGVWNSGVIMTGQTFMFTFTQPGTFAYHCNIHPSMHGTVIVLAPDPTTTPIPQPVMHPTAPAATTAPAVTVAPAHQPVAHPTPTGTGSGQPPILAQPMRH